MPQLDNKGYIYRVPCLVIPCSLAWTRGSWQVGYVAGGNPGNGGVELRGHYHIMLHCCLRMLKGQRSVEAFGNNGDNDVVIVKPIARLLSILTAKWICCTGIARNGVRAGTELGVRNYK